MRSRYNHARIDSMADSLRTVSDHELSLFIERIGRSLAERPLEIDAVEHRERIAGLLRQVGGASFYELLEVGPTATPEKVHEGYERLARVVHPSHAPHLGLQGREDVLAVLFERATAAYVTLSHPGRRRDYDREMGPSGWHPPVSAQSRNEQNRDRARAHFNRATQYIAKDDYHYAIELLREAVRIDPQAKYFARLAELQERNVRWLHQAADCYSRALELGGPDPQIEDALARVQRRIANRDQGDAARRQADAADPRAGGAAAPGGGFGDPLSGGSAGSAGTSGGAPGDGANAHSGASRSPNRMPSDGVWDTEEPGDPGDDTQVDRWLHRGP